MKEELIDRYGDLPEEVSELLNLINVRNYASSLGVKTVNNSDGSLLIGLSDLLESPLKTFMQSVR